MLRPANALIAGLGVLVGQACIRPYSGQVPWIDALILILLTGAGNTHNDILDRSTDAINRPCAPLVLGTVSPLAAWAQVILCTILILVLSLLRSPTTLFASLAVLTILFCYNRYWKRLPLVGNLAVALLCATPLAWPMLYSGFTVELTPLISFAFLLTLGREVVKDLEDLPGDIAVGMRTLPTRVGTELATQFSQSCLALSIIMLPLPVLLGLWPKSFLYISLVICLPPLIYAMQLLFRTPPQLRNSQKGIKYAMLGGMLAAVLTMPYQ